MKRHFLASFTRNNFSRIFKKTNCSMSGRKFAAISCDDNVKWGYSEGICERYIETYKNEGDHWESFHASRGNVPTEDDIEKFDGFVISGGITSVNGDSVWVKKLQEFIVESAKHKKKPKIVGLCFGHQAIATALGGKVGLNPSKDFVLQSEEIRGNDAVQENEDFKYLFENGSVRLLQSHGECVTEVPKGAQTLASSSTCDHELVQYNEYIVGLQGHPEMHPKEAEEKILSGIAKKYGWDDKRKAEMAATFYLPLDSDDTNKVIRSFIHN